MSLLAQLHDLKLALDQFRLADVNAEEEQRIAHTAAKLVAMLDQVSSRAPRPAASEDADVPETLLSIARQYGIRVADLRRHNAHLQHFEDTEPLPRNTPVKIKGNKRSGSTSSPPQDNSVERGARSTPQQLQLMDRGGVASQHHTNPHHQQNVVFDTIRAIARDQNVSIDALISANRVLSRYDVDEPLPQDLDIVIPTHVPPAQRTYVLTFAGESIRVVADSVAHCRPEDLIAANPQLGNIGLDTRLPEGTRVALPR